MDWWTCVTSVREPRILVLQDVDRRPGFGAFVGEMHASIGRALGCVGCLTNGAVRDLPAVRAAGFHPFAGSLAVSHSYAHIVEFGEPVEIGGLRVASGDLLHGDCHGVLNVPLEIAAKVPDQAQMVLREERQLVEFCGLSDFSLPKLGEKTKAASISCEAVLRCLPPNDQDVM